MTFLDLNYLIRQDEDGGRCVHSESVHGASLLFNERTLFLAGIDQEGFFLPLYALLVSRHTLAPATWEAAKGPSGDDKISRTLVRCQRNCEAEPNPPVADGQQRAIIVFLNSTGQPRKPGQRSTLYSLGARNARQWRDGKHVARGIIIIGGSALTVQGDRGSKTLSKVDIRGLIYEGFIPTSRPVGKINNCLR
ncbi:hypothetical protein HCBG_06455 [Histoplasma capsulatum G186AR]|uniref:Uncharacterized protein n=1 Tax=Ajellomyces capsulatus (strain G186AR / H82 / ATCC MYA-2454 / RMSCC 2432) TaxID=447093 RepID=C0NTH5_AJECG|nr:uncharacterized protein HCBG_06455 [Histoplasma capsulatum G186AR]EEH05336.1 hypothetical protein HCBG_06455 [Histoplasma capsulatum G186AR]